MRRSRSGFTLISTIAFLLLLAAITLTLQSRSHSSSRLLSRLVMDIHDHAARDALTDRLRGLVADAMASSAPPPDRPRLNSTQFPMKWDAQTWQVRVQDVEGLIDLYLAPEQTLALLSEDPRALRGTRAAALAKLPQGARFPTLSLTLANFGLLTEMERLVTQAGETGALRIGTLPEELRPLARTIHPGPRENEQVTRVTIRIEKRAP